tara:strand:+ start:6887 stop:7411 length:525 start_codon:yes stop_codon:yes gene_type:complete
LEFVFEEPKRERQSKLGHLNTQTRSYYNDKLNSDTQLRHAPANYGQVEMVETPRKRKRKATTQKVKYLTTVKKKKSKKKSQGLNLTFNKVCWFLILGLGLRLVFMERGVLDYYNSQNLIQDKIHELELLKQENQALVHEIHEIKVNPIYQKKLAREHLGVIAKDEYLILFASDS